MTVEAPFTEFVFKGTSRCNLQPTYDINGTLIGGCDYVPLDEAAVAGVHGCYEYADDTWRQQPVWMPPEVTRQAALRIGEHAASRVLPVVRVILHGGEPLMAPPGWLDDFSTTVRNEIREKSPETEVFLGVTTNGTLLTPDKIAILERHEYKVALSLDGDRTANDRHRLDAQGRSVFDRVVRAAAMLRESKLSWGILSVIDPRNDPLEVLTFLASQDPESITPLLPHANHSVAPAAHPRDYGKWLNVAFDWYMGQTEENFIHMPDFHSLMMVLLGGVSLREAVAGRFSQELFFLPNGYYQRVDTIKSTEPGAVATGMNIFEHSIDDVAAKDQGIRARRLGRATLAKECLECPLLDPCGGGLYPHRFESGGRKLRIGDPVKAFVSAFQHPSAYCDTYKTHIPHVAQSLERALDARPGTLARPIKREILPYKCPAGYEMVAPVLGDEFEMANVHARAFEAAYKKPGHERNNRALQSFVRDTSPDAFRWRILRRWRSFTNDKQPEPNVRHTVFAVRETATQKIVGFVHTKHTLDLHKVDRHPLYPMRHGSDEIAALYVDPDHQGRGVGSALLRAGMGKLGSTVVLKTVGGSSAVDFYKGHGFVERPYWETGVEGAPFATHGVVLPKLPMSTHDNPYKQRELQPA